MSAESSYPVSPLNIPSAVRWKHVRIRTAAAIALAPELPDTESVESSIGTASSRGLDAEDKAVIAAREERERYKDRTDVLKMLAQTLLLTAVYITVNTVFTCYRLKWTVIESMYFSMATLSTVGFGDRYADDDFWNRFFVICSMYVGVVFVYPTIAITFASILQPLLSKGRHLMEWLFPAKTVDIDGDGKPDFKAPQPAFFYYAKEMIPGILLQLACNFASAVAFMRIEGWDFGTAFYYVTVTTTTVGYGDVTATSQNGMLFAFFQVRIDKVSPICFSTFHTAFFAYTTGCFCPQRGKFSPTNPLFLHMAHRILSPYCTPHSFIFHTALTAHSQRTHSAPFLYMSASFV